MICLVGCMLYFLLLALYCVCNANLNLVVKHKEDAELFIVSAEMEHEYRAWLLTNGLAYKKERADWRSEFPEMNIPYKRTVKLDQED